MLRNILRNISMSLISISIWNELRSNWVLCVTFHDTHTVVNDAVTENFLSTSDYHQLLDRKTPVLPAMINNRQTDQRSLSVSFLLALTWKHQHHFYVTLRLRHWMKDTEKDRLPEWLQLWRSNPVVNTDRKETTHRRRWNKKKVSSPSIPSSGSHRRPPESRLSDGRFPEVELLRRRE